MKRRPVKLPYQEGSWFEVPVKAADRRVVGVVARMDGRGGVLGYLFVLNEAPTPALLAQLEASKASYVGLMGDLGLLNSKAWPVISDPLPTWQRDRWPLPWFGGKNLATKRWDLSRYEEGHLDVPVEIRASTEEEARSVPQDGIAGAGFVEERLERLAAQPLRTSRGLAA